MITCVIFNCVAKEFCRIVHVHIILMFYPTLLRSITVAIGASLLTLGEISSYAQESVQPNRSVFYGNSVTLKNGENVVFNRDLPTQSFIATLHFVDCWDLNSITWQQGQPEWRPLKLGDYKKTGSRISVVWKLVAPQGQVFQAGTIAFRGTAIWLPKATLTLQAHSAFSGNNDGIGSSDSNGTVYGECVKSPAKEWANTEWTVALPSGKSEVFVTVIKPEDIYSTVFGDSLVVKDVALVPAQ